MSTFEERLKIGNEKEDYVRDILKLMGCSFEQNNEEIVTDIDLIDNKINTLMDVKYINTVFENSSSLFNIESDNCIAVSVKHLKSYYSKYKSKNMDVWVCFIIDFEQYNTYQMGFIPIDELNYNYEKLKNTNQSGDRFNFDKNCLYDTADFLNYYKIKLNSKNKFKF